MEFEHDIFLSYAHNDNAALRGLLPDAKGWVEAFHTSLERSVSERLGKKPRIWWDHNKLGGNEDFPSEIDGGVKRSVTLLTVLSPSYLNSDWCRKELEHFVDAAKTSGGIMVGGKARILKVVRLPYDLSQEPKQFQNFLGYPFYDDSSQRATLVLDPTRQGMSEEFYNRVDEVATDVSRLLQNAQFSEEVESSEAPESAPADRPSKGKIFLGYTCPDLRKPRDDLRKELEDEGYEPVLPERGWSFDISNDDVEAKLRECMQDVRLSVHPVGGTFQGLPSDPDFSIVETQLKIAREQAHAVGAGLDVLGNWRAKLAKSSRLPGEWNTQRPRQHDSARVYRSNGLRPGAN